MKKATTFFSIVLAILVFVGAAAATQNSSVVFDMVFGDTASLHCGGGDLVFDATDGSNGIASCLASVVFPTPTPTQPPVVLAPDIKPIVNIPIVPGMPGSADLDANNRAIVWAGNVSPNGSYFDSRFIFNPEGLRIRWQAFDQHVIVGDKVEFLINGREFSSTVNSGVGFSVGSRCTGCGRPSS